MPRNWIRFVLKFCGALMLALAAAARGDEPLKPAAPPEGEVTKHVFDQSKIFPGTVARLLDLRAEAVRPGQASVRVRQPRRPSVQRGQGLRRV